MSFDIATFLQSIKKKTAVYRKLETARPDLHPRKKMNLPLFV